MHSRTSFQPRGAWRAVAVLGIAAGLALVAGLGRPSDGTLQVGPAARAEAALAASPQDADRPNSQADKPPMPGPLDLFGGSIDLDIDSDNNNGTDPADRNTAEELIEDNPSEPGKFVLVNDDDDDRNGTPDKDQNGTIPEERDDLVPLVVEMKPPSDADGDMNYRLIYPSNIRIWRSEIRGDLGTDVVPSGVTQSYPLQGPPITLWVEGLDPSIAQADTRILAEGDPYGNGQFTRSDAVRTTIFSLTASPNSGPIGTETSWMLQPAISPIAFDATTTAQWDGVYQPLIGPPTNPFSTAYSAAQLRESGPADAILVAGDGTFTNAPDPTDLDGGGTLIGDTTFQFGSIAVIRAFDFAPETDAGVWEQVDYPDGPGGAVPPVLDGEWPELPLILLSLAPNPNNPSEHMLLRASGFHLSAVVRIDENPTTSANAPATIMVDLVSYDDTGVEIDRLENVVLQKLVPDGEPNNIVYHNDLSVPIVPVDVALIKANYPNVLLLKGFDAGSAVIIPNSE